MTQVDHVIVLLFAVLRLDYAVLFYQVWLSQFSIRTKIRAMIVTNLDILEVMYGLRAKRQY